jgi:hypothetical protein
VHTLSTCCLLVSGFFTEIVQQIHSLRASGVISSHFFHAAGSETRVFRKSAGTLWTTPAERFLVMALLYTWTLTVSDLAVILKCKESSIYNLTRRRGWVRYDNPIPVLRLPMGLRFRKSSVLAWLESQETTESA